MHIERHISEIFCHNSQNGYSRRSLLANESRQQVYQLKKSLQALFSKTPLEVVR